MNTVVKTRIIKIGSSHGVRIPKLLLDQSGLSEEVELVVQPEQLIIRPAQHPRHGWDEQFSAMAEYGDDHLLDNNESPYCYSHSGSNDNKRAVISNASSLPV